MKLYKTSSVSEDTKTSFFWDGTLAAAATTRKSIKAAGHSEIVSEDVDVPTDKPGLLAWLNANVAGE